MPEEREYQETLRRQLEKVVAQIDDEADSHEREAATLRLLNSSFNFASVVLGIAAPTLVAYFTRVDGPELLGLIAILLVAFAGATGILSNTFRWGERFAHTRLAAICLRELFASTRLEGLDLERTVRPEALPEMLSRLSSRAMKELHEITRSVVEREVAVIRKQRERIAASLPDAGSDGEEDGSFPARISPK